MKKLTSLAMTPAWLAAIIGIGFTHTGTVRPLAAAEKAAVYGGGLAGCFVDATSNCPATVGNCNTTNCPGSFGTGACPAGTTIQVQTQQSYNNPSEVAPPTPGNLGTIAENPITCLMTTNCTGCQVTIGLNPDVCKQGAAVPGGGTAGRTPSHVDPNSGGCPKPI